MIELYMLCLFAVSGVAGLICWLYQPPEDDWFYAPRPRCDCERASWREAACPKLEDPNEG